MKILDNIQYWLGVNPTDEVEQTETAKKAAPKAQPTHTQETAAPKKMFFTPTSESYNNDEKGEEMEAKNMTKVVLMCPVTFSEASKIADHVKAGNTVVLNLERADRDNSRRLVDFLSGVAYAKEGLLRRTASKSYVITPKGVDSIGELPKEEPEETVAYDEEEANF